MGKVKFKEVDSRTEAQVVIGFYRNTDSTLPQPFETNTLAYAFLGNGGTAFNVVGDIFFNDENFNWALSPSRTVIDFIRVSLHEILHSLGYHHVTNDPTAILYPSYNPNIPIKISRDTIDGLAFTYHKFDGPISNDCLLYTSPSPRDS